MKGIKIYNGMLWAFGKARIITGQLEDCTGARCTHPTFDTSGDYALYSRTVKVSDVPERYEQQNFLVKRRRSR